MSKENLNANVRQAGFQETDIVSIVKPITKWSHKVQNFKDLIESLDKAFEISLTGRKGPVLIDVPMNVQKEVLDRDQAMKSLNKEFCEEKMMPSAPRLPAVSNTAP